MGDSEKRSASSGPLTFFVIHISVRVVESARAQLCLKEATLFAVRVQDSFALDVAAVRSLFHFHFSPSVNFSYSDICIFSV